MTHYSLLWVFCWRGFSSAKVLWSTRSEIGMPGILRRVNDRRRIDRNVGLRRQWRRLRRPGLVIAFGRPRQAAVRRRLDLEAPVTRQMARARIIVPDTRKRIDIAAAINGRLHVGAALETPIALDHRIG